MDIFDPHIWLTFDTWMSLLTLTILEIVLGVDNLVFIAIVSNRLPTKKQKLARKLGLALALITRLLLLAGMKWAIELTTPLLTIYEKSFSGRDILLLVGGIYLVFEGTSEIHQRVGYHTEKIKKKVRAVPPTMWRVLLKIMFLDIIFSLDSVITAVGMAQHFIVMALAIVIAVILMIWASESLNRFIKANPTIEMLALAFLLLVGTVLVADAFHVHINRSYVYFAISFSLFVESINIVAARRKKDSSDG
ncbi:MAG: TerC family protein [Gammaproteobacteria bacterium]|nr:TerC family protein [Gammaproteobacteria bacterium]